MSGSSAEISFRVVLGVSGVDAAAWDLCAGNGNPFLCHAFLAAIEDSGSACAATGWQPLHLVAEDGRGGIVGTVPMYAKNHSFGEYVFDHAWADALERAGRAYYPKLQIAVPFTPVPGPRLLIRPDAGKETAFAMIRAVEETVRRLKLSSAHVTFPDDADAERFRSAGWLMRTNVQYHWTNRGYTRFEDFLNELSSRKRKAIRRERAEVARSGVSVRVLNGDDLKPCHWDAFHRLYLDTAARKWGGGYLTRDFFHRLGATMADRVVLILCEDDGDWVAGALNLLGLDALYGRNWGADGRYPFLHFEACYYRAIDFAIERGLARVEAGAQGEHKIQRGYLPVRTYSAHWIRDRGFRALLARHLEGEREAVDHEIAMLADRSPYRQEENACGNKL